MVKKAWQLKMIFTLQTDRWIKLHVFSKYDHWKQALLINIKWSDFDFYIPYQCFPKVPTADGFYRLLDISLSATVIEGSLLSIRLFEFWKSDKRLRSYSHLKIFTWSKWLMQLLAEVTISCEILKNFLGGGPPHPPAGKMNHLTTLELDTLHLI